MKAFEPTSQFVVPTLIGKAGFGNILYPVHFPLGVLGVIVMDYEVFFNTPGN
ncbi:unnamed protein product [marine sediment metagenome]|uniref:Uncharacterized protein n=1 Tax=marine sediment metagenome TaxID=412755 RepID=X1M2W1_9ZZZZ